MVEHLPVASNASIRKKDLWDVIIASLNEIDGDIWREVKAAKDIESKNCLLAEAAVLDRVEGRLRVRFGPGT